MSEAEKGFPQRFLGQSWNRFSANVPKTFSKPAAILVALPKPPSLPFLPTANNMGGRAEKFSFGSHGEGAGWRPGDGAESHGEGSHWRPCGLGEGAHGSFEDLLSRLEPSSGALQLNTVL